jgi:hypothetical protein
MVERLFRLSAPGTPGELSLAGKRPQPRLSPARFLDAEVSAQRSMQGHQQARRNGKRCSIASIDYDPAGPRFARCRGETFPGRSRTQTLEVPGRTVLHVGGRYRFKLFG